MHDLHSLTEADTRAQLIDPALQAAGWGVVEGSRVRREVITLGRLTGGGKRARGESADYVLIYKGQKLAVAVVHRDLAGLHAEVELERAMAANTHAASTQAV